MHECPDCSSACYCNGDIDDGQFDEGQMDCIHYKQCEHEDDNDGCELEPPREGEAR